MFEQLIKEVHIQSVYSHQETGIKVTYDRDMEMGTFFSRNIKSSGKNTFNREYSGEEKIGIDGGIHGLVLRRRP